MCVLVFDCMDVHWIVLAYRHYCQTKTSRAINHNNLYVLRLLGFSSSLFVKSYALPIIQWPAVPNGYWLICHTNAYTLGSLAAVEWCRSDVLMTSQLCYFNRRGSADYYFVSNNSTLGSASENIRNSLLLLRVIKRPQEKKRGERERESVCLSSLLSLPSLSLFRFFFFTLSLSMTRWLRLRFNIFRKHTFKLFTCYIYLYNNVLCLIERHAILTI